VEAQGWNVDDWSPEEPADSQYDLGRERKLPGAPATCTLLGPEGSAPGDRSFPQDFTATGTPEAGEYRPYFENYTVDASIFDPSAPSGAKRIRKCV